MPLVCITVASDVRLEWVDGVSDRYGRWEVACGEGKVWVKGGW